MHYSAFWCRIRKRTLTFQNQQIPAALSVCVIVQLVVPLGSHNFALIKGQGGGRKRAREQINGLQSLWFMEM